MMMGEDDDMEKKAVYLGRTLEWRRNDLGVRPDRRHVRSLLRESGMEKCRRISTPLSATVEKEGVRSDHSEVSAELATKHRWCSWSRIGWIWEWAAVELAKTMAIPRKGDDERLKRVVRYLHGHLFLLRAMVPSSGRNDKSCFDHGCRSLSLSLNHKWLSRMAVPSDTQLLR